MLKKVNYSHWLMGGYIGKRFSTMEALQRPNKAKVRGCFTFVQHYNCTFTNFRSNYRNNLTPDVSIKLVRNLVQTIRWGRFKCIIFINALTYYVPTSNFATKGCKRCTNLHRMITEVVNQFSTRLFIHVVCVSFFFWTGLKLKSPSHKEICILNQ